LIIEEFQKREKIIDFVKMKTRSGKSNIINTLIQRGESKIIVGTDANIFFHPDALKEMILPIVNDNEVHLVGGNLVYRGNNKTFLNSIAKNEKSYINWENNLKNKEGIIWGSSMGVEGGCYAIRRESFKEIPFGTLMEDFFLTMSVLKSNKKVVIAPKAICTEDVSNESKMEFKRKIRISQGNWQNLKYFYTTVLTNPFPIGLIFFCHKILRWMLPVFFFLGSLVNIIFWLLQGSQIIMISIIFQMLFLILFVLYPERFLPKTLSNFLKPLSYFSWMNIALFLGLIRYLRTSENGIWQPTTRNKL
jgi:cellulose synthase/poly-beta-1,6-N-acetylglucosamine synthase-like glycosyltransferase